MLILRPQVQSLHTNTPIYKIIRYSYQQQPDREFKRNYGDIYVLHGQFVSINPTRFTMVDIDWNSHQNLGANFN